MERVAIPFSRGSSLPRDRTQVSCTADRLFTTEPHGKLNGENMTIKTKMILTLLFCHKTF